MSKTKLIPGYKTPRIKMMKWKTLKPIVWEQNNIYQRDSYYFHSSYYSNYLNRMIQFNRLIDNGFKLECRVSRQIIVGSNLTMWTNRNRILLAMPLG